ncbi:MAG: hypothetical protein Q4D98_13410 [Planctomycetia bacterium]|nr:hypothetical protein [Planctomycetia bacterium]
MPRNRGREARSASACLPAMLQPAVAVVAPGCTGPEIMGNRSVVFRDYASLRPRLRA